jgi:hypothetical protein
MADAPGKDRKFNDEEVALIIKRAAELQQTEQAAGEPSSALTLSDVEQIAKEAGIDPLLIRRAALSLDSPSTVSRPSIWAGAPTRLVFERVVDGEVSPELFETLVDEIRRSLGDNGVPSVLGRSLAWTSSFRGGRPRGVGRQIDVNIVPRGGVTSIRVEEELRNLAGGLFGGLVGGGGGGSTGISIGVGMEVFHSAAAAGLIWVTVAASFYALARTLFVRQSAKRERELASLIERLEEEVAASIAAKPAQVGASASRSLPAGEGTAGEG